MIKLERKKLSDEVSTLIERYKVQFSQHSGVVWKELPNSLKSAYRNLKIKQHLIEESHEKCAYCESKFTSSYPGDIEHILEKSNHPEKSVEHENLTFSCFCCNNAKSQVSYLQMPHIDPFIQEPKNHLIAMGCLIFGKDDIGNSTRKIFDLNRTPLVEKRIEKISFLKQFIDRINSEQNSLKISLLQLEIEEMISQRSEFSFILLSFFEDYQNKLKES